MRDDHVARLAALRAAPPAKKRATFVEYASETSVAQFKVAEEVTEAPVAELLAAWRGPVAGLEAIPDTFNDKLDYAVDSWAKLEALNAGMLPVLEKYEMLQQDSPAVATATAAFVTNYRAIGAALAATEALAAGDASVIAATEARCADIAARLTALATELGVTLRLPFHMSSSADLRKLADLGVTAAQFEFLKGDLHAAGVAAPTFQLYYQATVDGASMADVIRKCRRKGPVLVLGRAAVGGWLFGGYMDCGLGVVHKGSVRGETYEYAPEYLPAPQARVFTLTNPHGLPPTAWSRGAFEFGVQQPGVCWFGMLESVASPLEWTAVNDATRHAALSVWKKAARALLGAGDDDDDHVYASRGPHGENVFTGTRSWAASEVLIYGV